ncbi:histidine kinase [Streptomyces sp. BE20]|uniref:sensor histidine kinase n=1 Tax=Streptomyces sp. BE20 TaxID=3002525 RepID=UPI002E799C5C|nr:histidine kinase [Streptomyces sp. BE20]MEE1821568.1 histidine kinase [Streptomyces sp. BE20]
MIISPAGPRTAEPGRLGRLTGWPLLALGPLWLLLAANDLAFNLGTRTQVMAAPVLIAVAVQHTRLIRRAVPVGRAGRAPLHGSATAGGRWSFLLLAAAIALWGEMADRPYTALDWAMLPGAMAAALALSLPARARRRMLTAVAVGCAVLGEAVAQWRHDHPELLPGVPAATGAGMVLFIAGVELMLVRLWRAVLEAEHLRETTATLAVAEERLRFAADLHDLQGHRLQVITLKGELAERLIGRSDHEARTQVREISELARSALEESRAVVHGYRRASLSTELANAAGILEAAGIATTIDGDAARIPHQLQPAFAALVREGVTNILRHSRARHCRITITADPGRARVLLRNDGAPSRPAEPGSGLAGLQERFHAIGGYVRIATQPDGHFELTGHSHRETPA